MQCRDDWHCEPGEQRKNVASRFSAEDAELMLQRNGVKVPRVQELGCVHIIFQPGVIDLVADDRRIVIGAVMIGHRHDAGFQPRSQGRNRLFQIGGESGDAAPSRQ